MFPAGPGVTQVEEVPLKIKLLLQCGIREKGPTEYSRRCLFRWFYLEPESGRTIRFKQSHSSCFYFGSAGVHVCAHVYEQDWIRPLGLLEKNLRT